MQFEQEFKIGQQVKVVQGDTKPWSSDWRDTYIVTGARLEYQRNGKVNYSIATLEEIQHGNGDTDGFYADSLILA